MHQKQHIQKSQFLTKIALAFLVFLGCADIVIWGVAAKLISERGNNSSTYEAAVKMMNGRASLASFWQGVTCFFGINCPVAPAQPLVASQTTTSTRSPKETAANIVTTKNAETNSDATYKDPGPVIDQNQPADTNTHIIQNINPTKEIQTKEIQTVHTNTVTEHTNTVVVDEDTKNKVNLLLRQLDSDRPNYSVGQTYALPANLLGSTLNIGAGNFTINASGDANAQNITTEHDLTVRGNFSVTGTQTYTGAANFTSSNASSTLTTANTGTGLALQADNLTFKTNTLNTTTGNLILNSNTGLVEIAGSGIKLTNSVPGDTSMALYNDSGTLKWNGAALAMGSSVSGTVGYVPKFTSSNALGNSVIFESGSNVGIGTTALNAKLNISSSPGTLALFESRGSTSNSYLTVRGEGYLELELESYRSGGAYGGLVMKRARGTIDVPLAAASGDELGYFFARGYDGTAFRNSAGIQFTVDGNPSAGYVPGKVAFFTAPEGGNWVERMRINSAGNIGIGTASPLFLLDVAGSFRATATSTFSGNVGIGTTNPQTKLEINGTLRVGQSSLAGTIQLGSGAQAILSSTTDVFRIQNWSSGAGALQDVFYASAGNVGIGTTVPGYKLEVNGTIRGTNMSAGGYYGTFYANPDGSAALPSYRWNLETNTGIFRAATSTIGISTNGIERLRVDSSGNVGIGTTALVHTLDVRTTDNAYAFIGGVGSHISGLKLGRGDTGNTYGELNWDDSGNILTLKTISGSFPMRFSTNGAERVRIDASGNVGIGTTAPGYKMDVTGSLRIGGNANALYFDGTDGLAEKTMYLDNADNLHIKAATGNFSGYKINFDNAINESKIMFDTNTGNVGIGTTSMLGKLDINTVSGEYIQRFTRNGAILGDIYKNTSGPLIFESFANATTTADFSFMGGNLGIGTTTPVAKLQIGTLTGSGGGGDFYSFNNASDPRFLFGYSATLGKYGGLQYGVADDSVRVFQSTAGTSQLVLTSSGNVGIGTTTPENTLAVGNFGVSAGTIRINSATNNYLTLHGDGYINETSSSLRLQVNSTTYLTFDGAYGYFSNSNIGIGTSVPASKLTVRGDSSGVVTDLLRLENLGTAAVNSGTGLQFIANRTTGGVTEFGRIDSLITNIDNTYYSGAMRFKIAANGSLDTVMEMGNPNIVMNRPLEVNVAGDVGIAYDLQFTGTGEAHITSSGPFTILAGSPNVYDNLLLAVAGDDATNGGDIIADIRNSNTTFGGFKIGGVDNGGYVMRVDPNGNVEVGGNGSGTGNLTVKQNINLTGGNIAVQKLSAPANATCVPIGTAGSSTYRFQVTALNDNGETTASTLCETTTGNATLDTTNYVLLAWDPVSGATKYRVYGCAGAACTPTLDNDTEPHASSPVTTYNVDDSLFSVTALPAANTTGGNLAIGRASASYALDVLSGGINIARFNGTNNTGCTLSDGGIIACSSDQRLKKNIENTVYGINDIMKLRPVSFNWNTDSDDASTTAGFLAQEVEEVLPKLVMTDGNGYKELNTIGLVPVLVKAVQEQQLQIEELRLVGGLVGATSTGALADSNGGVSQVLKNLLASVGMGIENGVATLKNIFADTVRVKKIEMIDEATGQIYCTKIVNGEWVKTLGACPQLGDGASAPQAPVTEITAEQTPQENITPPSENNTTTTEEISLPETPVVETPATENSTTTQP